MLVVFLNMIQSGYRNMEYKIILMSLRLTHGIETWREWHRECDFLQNTLNCFRDLSSNIHTAMENCFNGRSQEYYGDMWDIILVYYICKLDSENGIEKLFSWCMWRGFRDSSSNIQAAMESLLPQKILKLQLQIFQSDFFFFVLI